MHWLDAQQAVGRIGIACLSPRGLPGRSPASLGPMRLSPFEQRGLAVRLHKNAEMVRPTPRGGWFLQLEVYHHAPFSEDTRLLYRAVSTLSACALFTARLSAVSLDTLGRPESWGTGDAVLRSQANSAAAATSRTHATNTARTTAHPAPSVSSFPSQTVERTLFRHRMIGRRSTTAIGWGRLFRRLRLRQSHCRPLMASARPRRRRLSGSTRSCDRRRK